MKCREFNEQAAQLTLSELAGSNDERMLTHRRECAECANWLQERQALAGALHALRSRTATLEAGVDVERAVLRAFRQSSFGQSSPAVRVEQAQPASLAFSLSRLFGWGAYAAVAAALAVALGLGIWYWQHAERASESAAQSATNPVQRTASTKAEIPTAIAVGDSATDSPATKVDTDSRHSATVANSQRSAAAASASDQSLARMAQAQGYVPLMLCDPLSCSGEEQVVRMEIPANATDASNGSEPQMADVVIGDDGLVRAIRIVQH